MGDLTKIPGVKLKKVRVCKTCAFCEDRGGSVRYTVYSRGLDGEPKHVGGTRCFATAAAVVKQDPLTGHISSSRLDVSEGVVYCGERNENGDCTYYRNPNVGTLRICGAAFATLLVAVGGLLGWWGFVGVVGASSLLLLPLWRLT